ncbi:RNA ligase family protein [Paenibacillus sp. YPG26]|uniref:ATP-dependent DNA ligase n=1 Tax=Paenibacillus sp. YPG26 TaxID=2878915 RepID=UPI0020413628|nr:RNA ligase family protein [Paenibacillus sp. YPG26]USB34031.1 DNA ligase [Paenibacillus sp. YPG26]
MNLQPVVPFEPISTDKLPEGESWTAQIKWDGVRMLTYFDGHETQLVNRKLNNRTLQYPELTRIHEYCRAESVILDGEVIALHGGKPSFHEVMRRDGSRKAENIRRARQEVPVTYMLFDILYHNGSWLTGLPLRERQRILREVIIPTTCVQVTADFPSPDVLYEVMSKHGMEGVVVKNLDSSYALDGKDKRWMKKKIIQDLVAVVGGYTLRGGIVNALMLGLYDEEGRLWYIGHAGTGKLSVQDWRDITVQVAPITRPSRPFTTQPSRSKDAYWVEPQLTVKVNFLEWTPGGTLRQPSIQAVVTVDPATCKFGSS